MLGIKIILNTLKRSMFRFNGNQAHPFVCDASPVICVCKRDVNLLEFISTSVITVSLQLLTIQVELRIRMFCLTKPYNQSAFNLENLQNQH
jgi:hypothetical protein